MKPTQGAGERVDAAEAFFAEHPLGVQVLRRLRSDLKSFGDVHVDASTSQVAFRRKHGFAYLWLPGQYLRNPAAEVVLSIALGRRDDSRRFKEVVHPSRKHWMHHLEVHQLDDIDEQVLGWMREAAQRAG